MRIVHVSDNWSEHNYRFLGELAKAGVKVWFCVVGTNTQPRPLPPGVNFLPLDAGTPISPATVPQIVPEFRRMLRRVQPDIVHAGPVPTCGYLAALTEFHPLLAMSWGSDILVDADRNDEWHHATEIALTGADAFFCDCDAVRIRAQQFAPLRADQILQFPWGVELSKFSNTPRIRCDEAFCPEPGSFTLICTRAWEPLYDLRTLLRGFSLAHRSNPSLRLWLLGGGSECTWMQAFIADEGLTHAIQLVGRVPSDKLPAWFHAADAYISCAVSDGTSVSLLEAMASGLPVIASDIPSNREWVAAGVNGFLAQLRSPDAFAGSILTVAALTAEQRERMAERNREVVRSRADWNRNFPQLLAIYERLAVVEVTR